MWISIHVSWEELQSQILGKTLSFRKKFKITYRQEQNTHKGAQRVRGGREG